MFCAVIAVFVVGALVAIALRDAGAFVPSWAEWETLDKRADIDGDDLDERIVLSGKRFFVYDAQGEIACATQPDWLVADAFTGDITRDGTPEIILLAWKRGSFGSSKPFWAGRDDPNYSEHVFIFDYADRKLQPVWMSSDMGGAAASGWLDEQGRLHLMSPDGAQTIWEWQSWGLALVGGSGGFDGNGANAGSRRGSQDGSQNGSQDGAANRQEDASDMQDGARGGARDAEGNLRNGAGGLTGDMRSDAQGDNGDPASETRTLSFLAVGDVIAHAAMCGQASVPDSGEFDFTPVFRHVRERVSGYDVAAVNQETILVSDPGLVDSYPAFGTPTAMGDALIDAGFDVVLGATNHANDKGQAGLRQTFDFWADHPEIELLGLHPSAEDAAHVDYLERNGIRIALFDYTYGLNGRALPAGREYQIDVLDERNERFYANVEKAETEADTTVCFLHIGEEYASEPTAEQRSLCSQLINAGADVVICSHPHVAQPVERVQTDDGNEGIVFWSLGNFVSNQTDPRTVLGGAAELEIRKTSSGTVVDSFGLVPTVSHFDDDTTEAYFLDDYTDELASGHFVNTQESSHPITLEALREKAASLN